ncbi:MAG: molybdopterin-dependent oxidoreductase [Pirellulales bacterium]
MAIVTINGQDIALDDHEKLNVIQAAKRAGVEIPHYCWHPALSVVASCRMCLVELGEKKPDGTIAMQPRLTPACQMPAKHGTVVVTNSKKVQDAQAATLEYLLLNHPLDCPTCDQAGECWLQDYSFRFGRSESRLREPKELHPDKPHIGDQITLFTDRCVMCTRCVRFTLEFSGTSELQVINRGTRSEIDIYPGQPCNNKLAGNVVDICPVGALCSKDFLYKQRVWWLQSRESVCPNCSTGCSIYVDQNNEHVYRLRPRENPLAQGHFMCDEGRFGFKYIHAPDRLTHPLIKSPTVASNGSGLAGTDWAHVLGLVDDTFHKRSAEQPSGVVGIFSPWMTCEDAYLLASWLRSLSPDVRLVLGPVPTVGEDDLYPKNWRGEPTLPPRFVIRAEKCPNRRGVAEVLRHFQPNEVEFDALTAEAESGAIQAAYIVHSGPTGWLTAKHIAALSHTEFLVVQDISRSDLSDAATVVLPGSSFAEKDGTFVNHAGLAQMIKRSIRCPAEGYTDGRIFMELAGRVGLFNARVVRQEMSGVIPYFAPLAAGDLGEHGVRLSQAEEARARQAQLVQ